MRRKFVHLRRRQFIEVIEDAGLVRGKRPLRLLISHMPHMAGEVDLRVTAQHRPHT
jgi:hypothetical protein